MINAERASRLLCFLSGEFESDNITMSLVHASSDSFSTLIFLGTPTILPFSSSEIVKTSIASSAFPSLHPVLGEFSSSVVVLAFTSKMCLLTSSLSPSLELSHEIRHSSSFAGSGALVEFLVALDGTPLLAEGGQGLFSEVRVALAMLGELWVDHLKPVVLWVCLVIVVS